MGNIISYLQMRGDYPFDDRQFCDVDNAVLSLLPQMDLAGLVPGGGGAISLSETASRYAELGRRPFTASGGPGDNYLALLAETKRYSGVMLSGLEEQKDENGKVVSAALCADLGDGNSYVAFWGADEALSGWRRAFRLSFEENPAHQWAADYLKRAMDDTVDRGYYTGGHGTGGTLALYASLQVPEEKRKYLLQVFCNDSPGLCSELTDQDSYQALTADSKLVCILPPCGLMGTLFQNESASMIVQSSGTCFDQHDAMTWQVDGNRFATQEKLDPDCSQIREILKKHLVEAEPEKRAQFTDQFFDTLENRGFALEACTAQEVEDLLCALTNTKSKRHGKKHKKHQSRAEAREARQEAREAAAREEARQQEEARKQEEAREQEKEKQQEEARKEKEKQRQQRAQARQAAKENSQSSGPFETVKPYLQTFRNAKLETFIGEKEGIFGIILFLVGLFFICLPGLAARCVGIVLGVLAVLWLFRLAMKKIFTGKPVLDEDKKWILLYMAGMCVLSYLVAERTLLEQLSSLLLGFCFLAAAYWCAKQGFTETLPTNTRILYLVVALLTFILGLVPIVSGGEGMEAYVFIAGIFLLIVGVGYVIHSLYLNGKKNAAAKKSAAEPESGAAPAAGSGAASEKSADAGNAEPEGSQQPAGSGAQPEAEAAQKSSAPEASKPEAPAAAAGPESGDEHPADEHPADGHPAEEHPEGENPGEPEPEAPAAPEEQPASAQSQANVEDVKQKANALFQSMMNLVQQQGAGADADQKEEPEAEEPSGREA